MTTFLPINGRIAIIENEYEHARPLMDLFSREQAPYLYYDGKLINLPEKNKAFNDVRLVFLDLNLIDNQNRTAKDIKGIVYGVLDRVISENNYPYLLVYWSRHEVYYKEAMEELFDKELKKKRPISFMSLNKGDYFELGGEKTIMYEEKIPELFGKIFDAINAFPIFNCLLNWENIVHKSADKTLEEIFKLNIDNTDWNRSSLSLFYKLSKSYSGKHFENHTAENQIKNALLALNYIFNDSLENSISNSATHTISKLEKSIVSSHEIHSLNKKLLISDEKIPKSSPGMLLKESGNEKEYNVLLNELINKNPIRIEIEGEKETLLKGKEVKDWERIFKKEFESRLKKIKVSISLKLECICIVVTPICDHVQNKHVYSKLVRGFIIDNDFKHFFNLSDAIFISPPFLNNTNTSSVIILDFRHLFSRKDSELGVTFEALYRIRQQLLSEIQSKLARHINRQGILFLED